MGDLLGFEGSTNEHHIFTEIFLGDDQHKTNKKCLVTGAINFQCDKTKRTASLVSLNNETAGISSQLNFSTINGVNEKSGLTLSPNGHALSTRDGKGIKLSPVGQPVFNSVNCRLVESTCHGITSICYLVKGDVSMHSLPSFNENDKKEVSASKAIYAPASRNFSVNISRSFKPRGKQIVKSHPNNLPGDETLSHKDSMKSPRPLLRKYIQALLEAAGWEITVRSTETNARWGFIYLSPNTRKPVRLFPKVWNICGQSLFSDSRPVLDNGKQWNDMSSFWSELSLTLSKVDEESSLAQQWYLLDPFVKLVFVDKKLDLLKLGVAVDVRYSVIDPRPKEAAHRNVTGNKSRKGNRTGIHESSPVGESVLTNNEANNSVGNDSCGTRITVDFGQWNRGTIKALNGLPIALSEEKCSLFGSRDGFNKNALQANNGLDCYSDHSSSCQFQIPPQDGMLAESVSPLIGSSEGVPSGTEDPGLLREDIYLKTPQAESASVKKRLVRCQIEDDALLISAFIKKKTSRSFKKCTRKAKVCKSKPLKKSKTQKGSCRLLLRSLGMGEKHNEGKWFRFGSRTVLSWLISCGIVSLKEVIRYQNSKDNSVVKEGIITKDGIRCRCCNRVISISEFKVHAGFGLNDPSLNIVMGSGKSFTLCQLEAWSGEYKTRKSATRPIVVEDLDDNDDSCGLCGDGGELICCDNCPSTFHQKCLSEQELPEDKWYCEHCSCRICGDLVVDKADAVPTGALKCSQCDHKYHEGCLESKFVSQDAAAGTWFCGGSCQEVYLGLQSLVGAPNSLSDGYSWTLLRCIQGYQKVHPAQEFVALKSECNSKLAVALTIMEECFLPMVDARTGIDMIPHVVYNWRSEFARLNYHGFYTMVLQKDDVLISTASIRIHGVTVAEMPLIATCSKFRRQGMCRRLMNSIEKMLISFKVEKLVITAIPDLVETWTLGFGFEPLEDKEKKSLSHFNLMVFPGTVWLKKTMYKKLASDELTSSTSGHAAPCEDQGEVALSADVAAMECEREALEIFKRIPDQMESQVASNLGYDICLMNDQIEEDRLIEAATTS